MIDSELTAETVTDTHIRVFQRTLRGTHQMVLHATCNVALDGTEIDVPPRSECRRRIAAAINACRKETANV